MSIGRAVQRSRITSAGSNSRTCSRRTEPRSRHRSGRSCPSQPGADRRGTQASNTSFTTVNEGYRVLSELNQHAITSSTPSSHPWHCGLFLDTTHSTSTSEGVLQDGTGSSWKIVCRLIILLRQRDESRMGGCRTISAALVASRLPGPWAGAQ